MQIFNKLLKLYGMEPSHLLVYTYLLNTMGSGPYT